MSSIIMHHSFASTFELPTCKFRGCTSSTKTSIKCAMSSKYLYIRHWCGTFFLRALTRFRVHFVAQWVKINDILAPKTFVRCKSGIYDSASWGTSNTICRLLSILFRHQVKIRLESLCRYLQDEETTALPWMLCRHCNATVTLFKWWNAVSSQTQPLISKKTLQFGQVCFCLQKISPSLKNIYFVLVFGCFHLQIHLATLNRGVQRMQQQHSFTPSFGINQADTAIHNGKVMAILSPTAIAPWND